MIIYGGHKSKTSEIGKHIFLFAAVVFNPHLIQIWQQFKFSTGNACEWFYYIFFLTFHNS